MTERYYTTKTVTAMFDGADYPKLNRFEFEDLINTERQKFLTALPTNVEYIAPQALNLGVRTVFLWINGAPSVREVRSYNINTDKQTVFFHAEYVLPAASLGAGETLVAPVVEVSPPAAEPTAEASLASWRAEATPEFPEAVFEEPAKTGKGITLTSTGN